WCAGAAAISTWRWIWSGCRCRGKYRKARRLEILFCALDDLGVRGLLEAVTRVLGAPARRTFLVSDRALRRRRLRGLFGRLFGNVRRGGRLVLRHGRRGEECEH